jgi:hypothetical protein
MNLTTWDPNAMFKRPEYVTVPRMVGVVDIVRWEAFSDLLARPDPPEMHRGHVVKYGGSPSRWKRWLPKLTMALWERLTQRCER